MSGEDALVTALLHAGAELVNDEARRLKAGDPEGCKKVESYLAAGMVPRLMITLGEPISVRLVLINDLGDEVLEVFETRAVGTDRLKIG